MLEDVADAVLLLVAVVGAELALLGGVGVVARLLGPVVQGGSIASVLPSLLGKEVNAALLL